MVKYWAADGHEDSTFINFDDPKHPRDDDFNRFLERACKQIGTSASTSHLYTFGTKTRKYHEVTHISQLVRAIKNRIRLYLWDSEDAKTWDG